MENNIFNIADKIIFDNITLENRNEVRDFVLQQMNEYSNSGKIIKPYIICDSINQSGIIKHFNNILNKKMFPTIQMDRNLCMLEDLAATLLDIREISSNNHTILLYVESVNSMIHYTVWYNYKMIQEELEKVVKELLDIVGYGVNIKIVVLNDIIESTFSNSSGDINISREVININENADLVILADKL